MKISTRALLLTDVVDSTQLSEELGDARMAAVWAAHDAVARELLPRHQGLEIDKTDGFLLLFEHVTDAVAYASAYHAALRALSASEGVGLAARAGVHFGDVILRENPTDQVARGAKPLEVDGLAKPTAARVMSVAAAGQTLLTRAAREALGPEHDVVSHGHWRMKGLAEPEELFEVGDEHAPFAPPEDGAKVYRVVEQDGVWVPVKQVPTNLVRPRDEFVGRTADLARLAGHVHSSPLVVVLGPGGTGKTRLVRRFGQSWLGDYPGGVWFCDLAEAHGLDAVLAAVAHAIDLQLGEDPIPQIGHALAGRGRSLVILDNFEQVVALAGDTLGRWLDLAPQARFVVTTRIVLGVSGEQVMPLEPLPMDTDAVALFESRARARKPGFEVTDANRDDVLAIVRTLDGLPLAIELAAARIAILPPKKLLERLAQRFKVLAGAHASKRQATLRAAIDWSWDLLQPWERAALAQCSAFEGGFTLEAAEAVLDLSAWDDAPWAMDVVQQLVDRSLLRSIDDRRTIDETFFGMYVSIHEYAAEKLRTPGAFDGSGPDALAATHERHGAFYASLGEPATVVEAGRRTGDSVRQVLMAERDNLRVATTRAIARGDGPTAVLTLAALWVTVGRMGPVELGRDLAESVVQLDGLTDAERARAGSLLAFASTALNRTREAVQAAEAVLALVDAPVTHRVDALRLLASRAREERRTDESDGYLAQAFALLQASPSPTAETRLRLERGISLDRRGAKAEAEAEVLCGLELARATDQAGAEVFGLQLLGEMLLYGPRRAEARERFEEARRLAEVMGDRRQAASLSTSIATVDFHAGRLDEARAGWEGALRSLTEIGHRSSGVTILVHLANINMVSQRFVDAYPQLLEAHQIFLQSESLNRLHTLISLGICETELGRLDSARARFEDVIRMGTDARAIRVTSDAHAFVARVHNALGELDQARTHLARSRELADGMGLTYGVARVLAIEAVTEALAKDPAKARRALTEGERIGAQLGIGPASELGALFQRARDAIDAAGPGARSAASSA